MENYYDEVQINYLITFTLAHASIANLSRNLTISKADRIVPFFLSSQWSWKFPEASLININVYKLRCMTILPNVNKTSLRSLELDDYNGKGKDQTDYLSNKKGLKKNEYKKSSIQFKII